MSPDDLRHLWQAQDVTARGLTAEEVHNLKRKRVLRNKRIRVVAWTALAGCIALELWRGGTGVLPPPEAVPDSWIRVAQFAALIIWILSYRYYRPDRVMSLNLQGQYESGLALYRRDLEAHMEFLQYVHRWIPLHILMVLYVVGIRTDPALTLPFSAVVAVAIAFWYIQRRRELPALQAEMQAIESYRREPG